MHRRGSEIAYMLFGAGGGEHDLRRKQPSKVPFNVGPENAALAKASRSPISWDDAIERLLLQADEAGRVDEVTRLRASTWLKGLREDVVSVQARMVAEFGKYDRDTMQQQVQDIIEATLFGPFKHGLMVLPRMAAAIVGTQAELRKRLAWDA
jgi:hypothetical protein